MQKNAKSYTFLLSRSSKNRVYIKRIAVSKSYTHFGAIGLFLTLGITSLAIGVSAIARNPDIARSLSDATVKTQFAPEQTKPAETQAQPQAPAAGDYALNSGGPEEGNEIDGEGTELETRLKSIRLKSDPAYLPTQWAHLGKINNEFGFRRNPFGGRAYEFHPGMDIDGERGQEVKAPANGTVIKAGWTGGYGNMVEIDHGNGLTTRYGHMSKIETSVGDTIERGDLIGLIGSTGRSTGPHLHFELRLNEKSINPRHFLVPEPIDLTALPR